MCALDRVDVQANLGSPAPNVELPDRTGDPVRLADFRGRIVVLDFYPRAGTGGCTIEACGCRDHWDGFAEPDSQAVGRHERLEAALFGLQDGGEVMGEHL